MVYEAVQCFRAAAGAVSVPTGVDTMANYEEVLHLIRYRNWHTASLFDRKFKLLCSELNGRYVSNDFKVEVGEHPPCSLPASGGCK